MRLTHLVAEIIHTFLRHLRLVDHERILQVSAFDESYAQQRFYLAHEAERTGSRYLFGIVREVLERRVLLAQQVRLERNRHIHLIVVARLNTHRVSVLRDILNRFAHHIHLLLCILFLDSHACYLATKETGATIQNRHLRGIYVDDAVIHTHRV